MQRGDVRGGGNRAGERGHNEEEKRHERQQETNGLFFHFLFRPSGSPGLLLLSAESNFSHCMCAISVLIQIREHPPERDAGR